MSVTGQGTPRKAPAAPPPPPRYSTRSNTLPPNRPWQPWEMQEECVEIPEVIGKLLLDYDVSLTCTKPTPILNYCHLSHHILLGFQAAYERCRSHRWRRPKDNWSGIYPGLNGEHRLGKKFAMPWIYLVIDVHNNQNDKCLVQDAGTRHPGLIWLQNIL